MEGGERDGPPHRPTGLQRSSTLQQNRHELIQYKLACILGDTNSNNDNNIFTVKKKPQQNNKQKQKINNNNQPTNKNDYKDLSVCLNFTNDIYQASNISRYTRNHGDVYWSVQPMLHGSIAPWLHSWLHSSRDALSSVTNGCVRASVLSHSC